LTYIDRDDYRRQLLAILNTRPFDVNARQDGQYEGLRQAVRMLNEMPAMAACECEEKK